MRNGAKPSGGGRAGPDSDQNLNLKKRSLESEEGTSGKVKSESAHSESEKGKSESGKVKSGALSPIFKANRNGIPIHVWVDETRQRNQGFNLTAWELINEGISNSLIVDNVGGHIMQKGEVDVCITGTDRTALNGDVCNKIGTYLKAIAAYDNNIPFFVAAPISSIDFNINDGLRDIPIEERDSKEVSSIYGINSKGQRESIKIVPENAQCKNYAFDVTPAKYITKIITEKKNVDPTIKSISTLLE